MLNKVKTMNNIWQYAVGLGGSTRDRIAFQHPAIFPEKLAEDHILSWSNPNNIVLDPMCGSGTTCKMALLNKRKWLGVAFRTIVNGFIKGLRFFLVPLEHNLTRSSTV